MNSDATIIRTPGQFQTPGVFTFKDFQCKTLELPWKNNERQVSCIPKGRYRVVKRNSAKYGEHFWIKDVPHRDMILIHSGNYAAGKKVDILGCILVGSAYQDINNDGHLDIINSKNTMKAMLTACPKEFVLEIN